MCVLRDSKNFLPLPSLISPWLIIQIERFFIPRIDLWVIFLKPPFSLISHLNSLSNLTKFQKISQKYLNSLWIRPLFTIMPFNSWLIPKIGKLGLFLTRDHVKLTTSQSRPVNVQCKYLSFPSFVFVMGDTGLCSHNILNSSGGVDL